MRSAFVIVASLIAVPALAQEPVGCDKFKWPIDRERALLADAKLVAIGADVADGAGKLRLSPVSEIKLPPQPSRNPKPNSYAGFVRYASPPHAGTQRFTLSEPGASAVAQEALWMECGAF